MKRLIILTLTICSVFIAVAQNSISVGDSLKKEGLLMPALAQYGIAMAQNPTPEVFELREDA